MRQLNALLPVIVLLAVSCQLANDHLPENPSHAYFPLADLVDRQIALLSAQQRQVLKIVQTGDQKPDTVVQQRVNWQNELDLFKEADINKPAWIGEYAILADSNTTIYRAKENQPVKELRLIGQGQAGEVPLAIEAHIFQSNLLYTAEKHMTLQFDNNLLKSYHIKGWQKIIFADTMQYAMHTYLR
ncbi:MAG: hypothetical protein RMJ44_03175 [Cytophagales bacterium]|nr:hypothetical protein [Bernardetiaceae bacterium]MDW8210065.1 hypothetical protein [Cytophagales bacterium]